MNKTARYILIVIVCLIAVGVVGRLIGRGLAVWSFSRSQERGTLPSDEQDFGESLVEAMLNQEDPFHQLCARGNADQIRQAIAQDNRKVNLRNQQGFNSLMFAAMYNSDPMVIDVLLDAGADREAVASTTENPLMLSAKNDNLVMVKKLLAEEYPVDARTGNGKTALMIACNFCDDLNIIEFLLQAGADVNLATTGGLYKGYTPLMFACKMFAGGNPEKLRILLDAGADINVQNAWGETALIIAVQSEVFNEDVIRFLLDNGADSMTVDQEGNTAMDYVEMESTRELFREYDLM